MLSDPHSPELSYSIGVLEMYRAKTENYKCLTGRGPTHSEDGPMGFCLKALFFICSFKHGDAQ